MDRRQEKTRQAIFRALAKLLKEKSFANITVQEIIDEANVGRTTFYAHFNTKDDLLAAMCETIFAHVLSPHLEAEHSHDFSDNHGALPALLTHVLYHLKDEKEEILDLLLTDSADLFLHYFSENVQAMLEEHRDMLPACDPAVPDDYEIRMLTNGLAETVKWWAGKRMEVSPEEVAGYYTSVFLT